MAEIEKMYDKMFTDYPDVVSVPQLMKMLSVGRHAAYELVGSGKIQCFKVGRKIKIPKIKVIEFMLGQGGDRHEKCDRELAG